MPQQGLPSAPQEHRYQHSWEIVLGVDDGLLQAVRESWFGEICDEVEWNSALVSAVREVWRSFPNISASAHRILAIRQAVIRISQSHEDTIQTALQSTPHEHLKLIEEEFLKWATPPAHLREGAPLLQWLSISDWKPSSELLRATAESKEAVLGILSAVILEQDKAVQETKNDTPRSPRER
jgi:hypothetical protein